MWKQLIVFLWYILYEWGIFDEFNWNLKLLQVVQSVNMIP